MWWEVRSGLVIFKARYNNRIKMPFQFNSSKLFLTYPNCDVPKEDMLAALQDKFGDSLLEYVVAREQHANGLFHIHIFGQLAEAYRSRDPHCLDLCGHHENYQGCRSAKNVLKYCTKEDNFIANIDVATALKSKSKRRELFDAVIKKQKTLVQIVEEDPTLLKGFKNLYSDYMFFLQQTMAPYRHPTTRGT